MLTPAADLAERQPARAEPDAMLIPSVNIENAAPPAAAQDSC